MYKIYFNRITNSYEMMEMVRMFLPASAYQILNEDPWETGEAGTEDILIRIPDHVENKNQGKQFLYDRLWEYTGLKPDWGILTGVRPVKLTGELVSKVNSADEAKELLIRNYYLSEEKANLLLDTWKNQQNIMGKSDEKAVGVYVGIPFCPTRCVYCSFPSYQASEEKIRSYLAALNQEIVFTGREMQRRGWYPESIYIGGGTPTTLSEADLERLLKQINDCFGQTGLQEFTVEAGRPDTITREKLEIIKSSGAERISINPQSMKEETLQRIGRAHKPEDILTAFGIARKIGFSVINTDLIAGLPGEEPGDFLNSLRSIMELKPENITVHTLAVKRASKLKEIDEDYSYHQGKLVREMLERGAAVLAEAGYQPYYLYRQKQMTGNFENVGYALPGTESLYNIKIMEENQTILALGAGGISKVWYPKEKRLERIPNVSNFEIYVERIEEMLQRKRDGIFSDIGGNDSVERI